MMQGCHLRVVDSNQRAERRMKKPPQKNLRNSRGSSKCRTRYGLASGHTCALHKFHGGVPSYPVITRLFSGTLLTVTLLILLVMGSSAHAVPPKFHLTYEWKELHGPLAVTYKIHLYGNGTLRYSRATGFGPPAEYTPPKNLSLAKKLESQLSEAKEKKQLPEPPCGAPRGGVITIQGLSGKKEKLSLMDSKGWMRYGRIARALVDEVMNEPPKALESDCRALQIRMSPSKKRTSNLPKVHTNESESKLLTTYGKADSEESRKKALAALSWMKSGDPFFKYELLKSHPTTSAARKLLQYHTSVLTRNIKGKSNAQWLLQRLGKRTGPEYDYHRALLYVVMGRYQDALDSLNSFGKAMGRDSNELREENAWVRKAVDAATTLKSEKAGWGARRRAHAEMFGFYENMANMMWIGNPDKAPPLCLYFIRRASHQARLAFFSRGPQIRGSLLRRAQTFILTHHDKLVEGRWYRHPVWHRLDLIALTGYLRRHSRLFRDTGFSGPEQPTSTVERLVMLRRFKAAERFVERMGDGKAEVESSLRFHQGRALLDMERWQKAHTALMKGAKMGSVAAWAMLVSGLVEQGNLGAARQQISNSGAVAKTEDMKLAEAFLEKRHGNWKKSLAAAKEAYKQNRSLRARRAVGLALAALGNLEQSVVELSAAYSDPTIGCEARSESAEIYLRGKLFSKANKTIHGMLADKRCPPAWGHALLAASANKEDMKELAQLQSRRVKHHAGWDPDICLKSVRIMLNYGISNPIMSELLKRVMSRRPTWSKAHALLARDLAENGLLRKAGVHAKVALKKKPMDPAYRALYRAILKAQGDD